MFHRITEQLRLEGTCKDQPPYSKQGHQEEAVQDCVLLGSEHLYKLSEQPDLVFDHLHTKKMFSHIEVGFSAFHLWAAASHPVTGCHWEESGSTFFAPSVGYLYTGIRPS